MLCACAKCRFVAYWGTYNRIAPELRKEFVSSWSKDFQMLWDAGELNRGSFSDYEWEKLEMILGNPDRFYYEQEYWAKTWAEMNDEVLRLRAEVDRLEHEKSTPLNTGIGGFLKSMLGSH